MDPLETVRKACLDAIRACENAERAAIDARVSAGRARETGLANARARDAHARNAAQTMVADVQGWVREADGILQRMSLAPAPPPAGPAPTKGTIEQLTREISEARATARQALAHLRDLQRELTEERAKWWKFW